MENILSKPLRTVAVRGNIFSFLLPWDTVMSKLSDAWARNDFRQWPLDPDTACHFVKVHLSKGQETLIDQLKQLRVRSKIVKQMANVYIANHIEELMKKESVIQLLASRTGTLQERFAAHIDARVNATYPEHTFGTFDGAVPQTIKEETLAKCALDFTCKR